MEQLSSKMTIAPPRPTQGRGGIFIQTRARYTVFRMKKNNSPWLHQLDPNREHTKLTQDLTTDVVVVGAGIAGIATTFFILKNTDKKVVLLEKYKLGHGATGHNAGQVVSYFERGFASLVKEFGPALAGEGQRAVEQAWELLDEIYTDAHLDIPFSRFVGHAGLTSYEQVLWHLEDSLMRKQAGLQTEPMRVCAEEDFIETIPEKYQGLYVVAPAKEVLATLETKQQRFVAVMSSQKGCVNSALLCQEVLAYLRATYPERFALYEHTPVHKIILHEHDALLDADTHTLQAARVVLCTNGFADLHIINENGLEVDAKYHHLLSGKIGYMSGYLEQLNKTPTAISYYTDPKPSVDNSYYYLTRRSWEYEKNTEHNLISIGGPDMDIEESHTYSHEDEYPEIHEQKIDAFVRSVYDTEPNKKIDYLFTWHGLMGYTKNKVRLIGAEPQNPILLYNLGCNGVGILPSLYGGRRIARLIAGESLEKTIFDVPQKSSE